MAFASVFRVGVVDITTGEELCHVDRTARVDQVMYVLGGREVLAYSRDTGEMFVLDARTCATRREMKGSVPDALRAATVEGGATVVGLAHGRLVSWSVATLRSEAVSSVFPEAVRGLATQEDVGLVLMVFDDDRSATWNVVERRRIPDEGSAGVASLLWIGAKDLMVAYGDGTLTRWNTRSGRRVWSSSQSCSGAKEMNRTLDGQQIVITTNRAVEVWSAQRPKMKLYAPEAPSAELMCAGRDHRQVVAVDREATVHTWTVSSRHDVKATSAAPGHVPVRECRIAVDRDKVRILLRHAQSSDGASDLMRVVLRVGMALRVF